MVVEDESCALSLDSPAVAASCGLLVPLRSVNLYRKALADRTWLQQLRPPADGETFREVDSFNAVTGRDLRYLVLTRAGQAALGFIQGKCSNADLGASLLHCPRHFLVHCYTSPPPVAPSAAPFSFIDLFAGVGGFACGLHAGRCLLAVEKDREASELYVRNHGEPAHGMHKDIYTLPNLPLDADLLCAGFPCQSFSRAGDKQGLDCPKNGALVFEIVRLLKQAGEHAPRALLLENVRNLLDMDGGETFDEIIRAVEDCGYTMMHKVIFSNEQEGLPQRRERLYIVGFRKGSRAATSFEWPAPSSATRTVVRDVLESGDLRRHRLTEHQWAKVTAHKSWHTSVLPPSRRRLVDLDGCARTLGALYRTGYMSQSEFVEYEGGEERGAGSRPRFFTPRECARLQGFPESFIIEGPNNPNRWYHQCGNAVSPPVVARITQHILSALGVTLDS